MEAIIFVVLMVVGHVLMMFLMPGMHGGQNHKGQGHADSESEDKKKLEIENKRLKEELNVVKSKINQNEL